MDYDDAAIGLEGWDIAIIVIVFVLVLVLGLWVRLFSQNVSGSYISLSVSKCQIFEVSGA